jgi:hypothetical protein
MAAKVDLELLEVNPVTGRRTGLAACARRALRALRGARIPYAVVGATALAVRGLPRMTRDIDVVVLAENAFAALAALQEVGFRSLTPVERHDEPEPMYVMRFRHEEVDLLIASGEPESTVVAEAPKATVFGVRAPVARLEHLLLMYLYSNQPKHIGDFARIVTERQVDLGEVERFLADVHPEMLSVWRDRLRAVRHPEPPPPRPRRRRSRP